MSNKIENLAIELWLEIFDHLTIHEQFNAFFGLNKRLDQILFSYRTRISLKDNDKNAQHLLKHVLPYLIRREDVTHLRLENTNKIYLDDYGNLLHFPRLNTLYLHRMNITKDMLSCFQQSTTNLQYLNMSSTVSSEKGTLHELLKMILSRPNLQKCHLRLGISMAPIAYENLAKSPIKHLHLIGKNESLFTDRLISLLKYLPNLQKLNIVAKQMNNLSSTQSSNKNISQCPVTIFTLNINSLTATFAEFGNFLSHATPCVEELKIICHTPIEDITYLECRNWRTLITSLKNLKKVILNIRRPNAISEQVWDKNCQILTKIMNKNLILFAINGTF